MCRLIWRWVGDIIWAARGARLRVRRRARRLAAAGNAIGWIFCAGAVAFSLSGLGRPMPSTRCSPNRAALRRRRDDGLVLGLGLGLGGVPLLVLFPLLFPNGKPLSRRWRPVAWRLAGRGFLSVGIALSPGTFDDLPEVENPYGVGGAAGDVLPRSKPWAGCC